MHRPLSFIRSLSLTEKLSGIFFLLAFLLAFFPLFSQLPFAFDQARDAFEAASIWRYLDIKILGPSSDIPGLHHGALWYYLLALPYAIGRGEPLYAAVFFFFLSFLSVIFVGFVTYKLFDDRKVTLGAMLLYSFSPLFQVFTRWLSNPVLALYIVPGLLLALWSYIKRPNSKSALFTGVGYGLLIQSDFAYGLFLVVLPLTLVMYRVKVRLIDAALFSIGFIFAMSTYLIGEMKYKGMGSFSLFNYLQEHSSEGTSLLKRGVDGISKFQDMFSIILLPILPTLVWVLIITIFLIFFSKKVFRKDNPVLLLVVWVISLVFFQFFSAGILQSSFIYGPFLAPVVMLSVYALSLVLKKESVFGLILILVIVIQSHKTLSWIQQGFNPLSVQWGTSLSDEKEIIDYTYNAARGEKFGITTVTVPLYINTTWAYLYEYYGEPKYSFMPYWLGHNQEGYLGKLPSVSTSPQIRFLVLEPGPGIPDYYRSLAVTEEDTKSKVQEKREFGRFEVEKRILAPSSQL